MNKIFPEKLKKGDEVRIIAPSRSMAIINDEVKNIANQRFFDLGLKLSYGLHIQETDEFASSSIASRVADIHDAFSDKNVRAIITVIGGFNANQLLRYLDWDLIRMNPKIFVGFSDITVLNNAIYAKTGLVSYSGPHYSSFGQKMHFDYTLEYFKKCLLSEDPLMVNSSPQWSDDEWYINQNKRELIDNEGYQVINEGEALGTILGGNLCSFNLLQGTEYFPDLSSSVLFLEDDYETLPHTFDRDLQSLLHLPQFNKVRGLVIGRFQKKSRMTESTLIKIIKTKKELSGIPVIANADFGHSDPKITFPIGGEAIIKAFKSKPSIIISKH